MVEFFDVSPENDRASPDVKTPCVLPGLRGPPLDRTPLDRVMRVRLYHVAPGGDLGDVMGMGHYIMSIGMGPKDPRIRVFTQGERRQNF